MLSESFAFSGFSVNDLEAAATFYRDILGVTIEQDEMGVTLKLKGGTDIFVYAKPDHQPATFTILNFVVDNIDETIDGLVAKGVTSEQYDDLGGGAKQDDKGVLRGLAANMGPDIAWFKDPAGNILSVIQQV